MHPFDGLGAILGGTYIVILIQFFCNEGTHFRMIFHHEDGGASFQEGEADRLSLCLEHFLLWRLDGLRLLQRQKQAETSLRPVGSRFVEHKRPVVHFRQRACQRQSQSGARLSFRVRNPVERLEDLLPQFFRYGLSVVDKVHLDLFPVVEAEMNPDAAPGIFDGIGQQVTEDLRHGFAVHISIKLCRGRRPVEQQPLRGGRLLEAVGRLLQQFHQVGADKVQAETFDLGPPEVEQLIHQRQ